MVKCPYCHNEITRVWRNQMLETGYQRTRKCMKCKKKFTTEEHYTGAAAIVLENKRRYHG